MANLSVLTAKKGKVLPEKYYNGPDENSLHNTRSATKTMANRGLAIATCPNTSILVARMFRVSSLAEPLPRDKAGQSLVNKRQLLQSLRHIPFAGPAP